YASLSSCCFCARAPAVSSLLPLSLHDALPIYVGAFHGEVGIHDAALGHLGVVLHVRQVVAGVVQAVDGRAKLGAHRTDFVQCGFQASDGSAGSCGGGERQGLNGGGQGGCQGADIGADIECHGLSCARTDLEVDRSSQFGGEQVFTRVLGVVEDVGQLFAQGIELGLKRGAVGCGVGVVRRLGRQILHALQDVGSFAERAFGGLQHGNRIAGVAHGNAHATALSVQASGDLQTGGIIGGRVDAQAGAQALLVGGQCVVGLVKSGVGGQGGI